MSDTPERRIAKLLQVTPEEHMRRLGENLLSQMDRLGDRFVPSHWVSLIQGATSALVATGQLTKDRAWRLQQEALRPLLESGVLEVEEAGAEASLTARTASRDINEGETRC